MSAVSKKLMPASKAWRTSASVVRCDTELPSVSQLPSASVETLQPEAPRLR
jgi:hypothetical protein